MCCLSLGLSWVTAEFWRYELRMALFALILLFMLVYWKWLGEFFVKLDARCRLFFESFSCFLRMLE